MKHILILMAFFCIHCGYLISNPLNPNYTPKYTLNPKIHQFVLYIHPYCPYCAKVVNYLNERHISLKIKDINNKYYKKELVKIGGKKQVPCLVVHGQALYESSDIIDYLERNFKKP